MAYQPRWRRSCHFHHPNCYRVNSFSINNNNKARRRLMAFVKGSPSLVPSSVLRFRRTLWLIYHNVPITNSSQLLLGFGAGDLFHRFHTEVRVLLYCYCYWIRLAGAIHYGLTTERWKRAINNIYNRKEQHYTRFFMAIRRPVYTKLCFVNLLAWYYSAEFLSCDGNSWRFSYLS